VQKTPSKKLPKIILSGILAIATLLGYVVLIPRVTASVSDPVDPSNPFSSSLTITNTGLLPLSEVEPEFGLKKMTFGNPDNPTTFVGPADKPGDFETFQTLEWETPSTLDMDGVLMVGLNDIWGKQPSLLSADIAIIVSYRLPLIHLKRQRIFPFRAVKQTNGNFYWYAKPS
jgi:hypothetical protein